MSAESGHQATPGMLALDDVDFELERGQVHVLLGENRVGESTLIKMLLEACQSLEVLAPRLPGV